MSLSYDKSKCCFVYFVRNKFNLKLKGGVLFTIYLQTSEDFSEKDLM